MKKYKSMFILTIYHGKDRSKNSYSSGINPKMLEFFTQSSPGFDISGSMIAYFMSLDDAEKYIKKKVKISPNNIYGFTIEEKPFGGNFPFYQVLSQRRYLNDGTLWQKNDISNVILLSSYFPPQLEMEVFQLRTRCEWHLLSLQSHQLQDFC